MSVEMLAKLVMIYMIGYVVNVILFWVWWGKSVGFDEVLEILFCSIIALLVALLWPLYFIPMLIYVIYKLARHGWWAV